MPKQKDKKRQRTKSLVEQGYQPYLGTCRIRPKQQGLVARFPGLISVGSNSFSLFGDESISLDIVAYGLVVVNESDLLGAERSFLQIIENQGLPAGSRFHAREVFYSDARAKTSWAQLTDNQTWKIARDLLLELRKYRIMYCLGIVHQHTYPKEMPDGNGHTVPLTPETFYPLAFQGAMSCADAHGLFQPKTKCQLWVDPQHHKIKFWGAPRSQVQALLQYKNVKIKEVQDKKPFLLDVADLFVWSAARSLSGAETALTNLSSELFGLCNPTICDCWWQPEEPKLPVVW